MAVEEEVEEEELPELGVRWTFEPRRVTKGDEGGVAVPATAAAEAFIERRLAAAGVGVVGDATLTLPDDERGLRAVLIAAGAALRAAGLGCEPDRDMLADRCTPGVFDARVDEVAPAAAVVATIDWGLLRVVVAGVLEGRTTEARRAAAAVVAVVGVFGGVAPVAASVPGFIPSSARVDRRLLDVGAALVAMPYEQKLPSSAKKQVKKEKKQLKKCNLKFELPQCRTTSLKRARDSCQPELRGIRWDSR